MKRQYNIQRVFFLLTIYCFGIGSSTPIPNSSYKPAGSGSKSDQQIFSHSNELGIHTRTAELIHSGISECENTNTNQSVDRFLILRHISGLRFYLLYKHYRDNLNAIAIGHRKTDPIFPFHLFW